MMNRNGLWQPFGEECCETETELLKDNYQRLYFTETPFNEAAIDANSYMFVGRRGSGKSSLAHYFTFQNRLKHCKAIDVDEPETYFQVLSKISEFAADTSEVAIPRIVGIWEYIIWNLIFDSYAEEDIEIKGAKLIKPNNNSPASLIKLLIKSLLEKFLLSDSDVISDSLEDLITSPLVERAKQKALTISKKKPIIIAIDSLEKYGADNSPMMRATAALIECASKFNLRYASEGIHVKIFISAEVFPYLAEHEVSNVSKYVRNEIYMHWRPKDLGKLVMWRYFNYLSDRDLIKTNSNNIDWKDFDSLKKLLWDPFFGETILNRNGIPEESFPYIIRHTQMRPRQLVIICNSIARNSRNNGSFPNFTNQDIVSAVAKKERMLATEVINSYSKAYENVGDILTALSGANTVLFGKELDRVAHRTASVWPDGRYSPFRFRRLVAELGIIGRIRYKNDHEKIIEADFEYNMEERLSISESDECVFHPMFREKFNIKNPEKWTVLPFPDHPTFNLRVAKN